MEEKAAYVFTTHRDVADVHEQPAPVSFIDEFGRSRKHTFDFLLMLKSGRKIAVQIKPSVFEAKWRPIIQKLAEQMSRQFADAAVLMTERDFDPIRVHNAMLIHAVRRDPPGTHDDRMHKLVCGLTGSTRIGQLVENSGLAGYAFRAIVRLIADGELEMSGGRIDYSTLVMRPTCVKAETV